MRLTCPLLTAGIATAAQAPPSVVPPSAENKRVIERRLGELTTRIGALRAGKGDTRLLSGRRKAERNEPLILAGQDYAFELTISNKEGDPWRTLDRIVLTSVMWDDGAVDGDPQPQIHERALARNRASQLQTILKTLTSRNATRVETLRAAFAGLDRSDRALDNARSEALTDLNRLKHAGADAMTTWVATKITEYSAWQSRCERAAQSDGKH